MTKRFPPLIAFAASAICAVLMCGCSSNAPAPTASAAAVASAPPSSSAVAASPSATASAGPLVLAHFPSTTDGRLARGICRSWARLRVEYYQLVQQDSSYQLNQWFSSANWSTINNDGEQLGNDPAYSNLETALGVGMVGDMANVGTARQIDLACAKGG
jgi:hypothetical protein